MPQVSILGCGWLGLDLGKQLLKKNYTVKGSTTTPGKIPLLQEAGIIPFTITVGEDSITGTITALLQGSECLIIAIPPGLLSGGGENFVSKIQNLIPMIETAGITKVIFISSTSVYGDYNGIVNENTAPAPTTESDRQLWETEQLLQSNTKFATTVVRFGGLIGSDRHPVHYLAGKVNLSNAGAPVNLIHKDDCIGIILTIIEKDVWGTTFNAVTPCHPTREEYYTRKAKEKNLPLPLFSREEASVVKVVAADKIKEVLGYNFIQNNL